MQIVVTGPRRSGASALARLLHLSGIHSGDALVSPQDSVQDESSRVWERVDLVGLNEWLISKAGADALDVCSFDIDLLGQPEMWEFHQRAATILEALNPHRPFFLKDPRFCLTLPMWEPLLQQAVVIFVQRSPLECARSLARRSEIAFSAALALWEFYVHRFASWNGSSRSLMVRYEDLVSEPCATLATVISQLKEFGVSELDLPSEQSVSSAISRPGQFSSESCLMAPIPESIEKLSKTNFSAGPVPELSDEARHELQIFHSSRKVNARWSRRLRLIEEESLRLHVGELWDRQNDELRARFKALKRIFTSLNREMSQLKDAPFWSMRRLKGAFRVLSKGDLKETRRAVTAFKEFEKFK